VRLVLLQVPQPVRQEELLVGLLVGLPVALLGVLAAAVAGQ
jgi:hypothetical protein